MRSSESLESPKKTKLDPGTRVEVLEIGTGPTEKRIRVRAPWGTEGWISVVSQDGMPLLRPAATIADLIGKLGGADEELLHNERAVEAIARVDVVEAVSKPETDQPQQVAGRPRQRVSALSKFL